ncbi:MAG: exodeoxyribonuclease III [Candidatus Lokiarchaeota archaeon]|nr:exodeoxyribonuclease III [Candidatus Lokiarchaeota archaeon]
MKIISWNVNGINSIAGKDPGLIQFMYKEQADVYCFQEVKVSEKTIRKELLHIKGYEKYYWNSSEIKKGHAGVITYVKNGLKPINDYINIGINKIDRQGRVVTLEFDNYFVVNCYYTNAGRELVNIDEKMQFDDDLLSYFDQLRKKKPVVICGDFNVAHKEIDIANPSANRRNAGFTDEEREKFTELLEHGYIDSFREFIKEGGHYTWWSYRTRARERNVGWRLDYFVISKELLPELVDSSILSEVYGSDHCPIRLVLQ